MKCRSCSAEIDAKAIVCYRCGTPTADPAALRPARPAPSSRTALWIALAILALGAVVYLAYFRPV